MGFEVNTRATLYNKRDAKTFNRMKADNAEVRKVYTSDLYFVFLMVFERVEQYSRKIN